MTSQQMDTEEADAKLNDATTDVEGKTSSESNPDQASSSPPLASVPATVKLIMYDFDQTITCLHLYRELHGGQLSALNKYPDSKCMDVFGGQQRLRQLQAHFQHLTSHHIEVAIISFGWTDVIKQALTRVNLGRFFEKRMIIGRDHKDMVIFNKNKAKMIASIMHNKNLKFDQALFVEDSLSNVQQSQSICRTVHISGRNGMTPAQMRTIESTIHVYSEQELAALNDHQHANSENGNVNKTHKKKESSLAKYRITKVPARFEKQFEKEATPVIEIEDVESAQAAFPDTDDAAATNTSTNDSEVQIASKFTFGDFADH